MALALALAHEKNKVRARPSTEGGVMSGDAYGYGTERDSACRQSHTFLPFCFLIFFSFTFFTFFLSLFVHLPPTCSLPISTSAHCTAGTSSPGVMSLYNGQELVEYKSHSEEQTLGVC